MDFRITTKNYCWVIITIN